MRIEDFSTKQEYYEWEYENALKWAKNLKARSQQAKDWHAYAKQMQLLSEQELKKQS